MSWAPVYRVMMLVMMLLHSLQMTDIGGWEHCITRTGGSPSECQCATGHESVGFLSRQGPCCVPQCGTVCVSLLHLICMPADKRVVFLPLVLQLMQ